MRCQLVDVASPGPSHRSLHPETIGRSRHRFPHLLLIQKTNASIRRISGVRILLQLHWGTREVDATMTAPGSLPDSVEFSKNEDS